MKKVYLHGRLGESFGREWNISAKSMHEVFCAIDANSEGFKEFMFKEAENDNNYIVIKGDINQVKNKDQFIKNSLSEKDIALHITSEEIHIIPANEGGFLNFIFKAIAGAIKYMFSAKAIANAVIMTAVTLGIQALTKPPEPKKPDNKRIESKSYLISGSTNRASQGVSLPVGYGELIIGSSNVGLQKKVKRYPEKLSSILQSYAILKYLDIWCEGPILGMVDQSGRVINEQDQATTQDFKKSVYLNNVPVKNQNNTYNYILTDDSLEPIQYTKGEDDNPESLWEDETSGFSSWITEYGTTLYGPSPYSSSAGSQTLSFVSAAISNGDIVDFAIENNAKIFSHMVSNPNVKQVDVGFRLQMSTTHSNMDNEDRYGDTEPNHCEFAVIIQRSSGEYNILDPDSGCVVGIPTRFQSTLNSSPSSPITAFSDPVSAVAVGGLSIQGNFNKTYKGSTKSEFGYYYWKNLSENQRANKFFSPVDTELEYEVLNNEEKESFETFVNSNSDVLSEYKVYFKNSLIFRVDGIATSPFEFQISVKFDFDEKSIEKKQGITFKVIKICPEYDPVSKSTDIGAAYANRSLQVQDIQERINEKFLYPNTALCSIEFDSRNFSSLPNRGYHLKLKKVLVPSNYNTYTRKYEGVWDGLFKGQISENQSIQSIPDNKKLWTDNPAWVFMDILSNPRFGLGKYGIKEGDIDKWQLYKISKYCDELVETGYSPETKNSMLRPFSSLNNLDNSSGGEGVFSISLKNYFWSTDNNGVLKFYENNFSDENYAPEGVVRLDPLSQENINKVFEEMLGRAPTSSESQDFLSRSEWNVGNLITYLLGIEEFDNDHQSYSTVDFIEEFGDGEEFQGKKVAIFIGSHKFSSYSEDREKKIQQNACTKSLGFVIEERTIIRTDPSTKTIFISGPSLEDSGYTISLNGNNMSFGGCCCQKNYPIVEPRFTSNVYITDKSEAISVINAMTSIFRGMVAYYAGKVSAVTDSPKSPVKLFTNANVSKDGFSYAGKYKNEKFSSCIVRFNNKEKNFKSDLVFEEDPEALQQIGFIEKEMMGFGVTSPSQARRLAKWTLLTSNIESDAIRFSTSQECASLIPGAVFEVSDEMRMGESLSGRIMGIEMQAIDNQHSGEKKEFVEPKIKLDKAALDLPNFARVEITIASAGSSYSYEQISEKSTFLNSSEDQDEEVGNFFSEQITKFEGSISYQEVDLDNLLEFKNAYITDLMLKKSFRMDTGNSIFKVVYHAFHDGDRVRFTSQGNLPSGLSKKKINQESYYVINSTKHTFQVAEQEFSSILSGVASIEKRSRILNGSGTSFLSELSAGDVVTLEGKNFTVSSISSNTEALLKKKSNKNISSQPIYKKTFSDPVRVSDEGTDFLMNKGGLHYVCPENLDGVVSDMTVDNINNISDGTTYSINKYISIPRTSGFVNSISDEALQRLGLNSGLANVFGVWLNSSFLGRILIYENQYIFSNSFGWIYAKDLISNNSNWIYISEMGWVNVLYGPSDKELYFKKYDGYSSVSEWVRVQQSSELDVVSLFIRDSGVSSKNLGDFFYLGGGDQHSLGRKMIISKIESEGCWLKFNGIYIDNQSSPANFSQTLSDQEVDSLPSIKQSSVLSIHPLTAEESVQGKPSILIKLDYGHRLNLFKNYNVIVKDVQQSSSSLNFYQQINQAWDSLYVNQNEVELKDSESLVDILNSETEDSIINYGSIEYVENATDSESVLLQKKMYRVVRCKEVNDNQFEIIGSEYNLAKFEAIDKDLSVRQPYFPIPPQGDMSVPEAPSNLTLFDYNKIN